jgi:hypothetical protein
MHLPSKSTFQQLYSTTAYYLTEIPEPHRFTTHHKHSSHWDPEGIRIQVANAEDFQHLANDVEKFQNSSRLKERIDRGDLCVVTYKHGALASFRWATFIPPEIPIKGSPLRLKLGPREAYTYDGYTIPRFRRQGIGLESRAFLMSHLAQQGITRIYSTTRTDNRFMIANEKVPERMRRYGIHIVGTIMITTFLGGRRFQFIDHSSNTSGQMQDLLTSSRSH